MNPNSMCCFVLPLSSKKMIAMETPHHALSSINKIFNNTYSKYF